jgi:uncharacterized nucleotidyltransferase DUF6036
LPDRAPIADLLDALGGVLRRLGVRWYLFGAQAVTIWGRPRMSADVDVTIEVDLARVPELVELMSRAGFTLRVRTGVDEFVARTRVLPFVHDPTRIPLDVVLAGPGIEEQFLDRAQVLDFGGVEVPVMSPEDLVVTKVLAGRPKDRDDVAGILRERGERLDLERIRSMLRLLRAI